MNDDQGGLRISNADRDKAIEQLREALGEGRLNLTEFDERSRAAYEAKTQAELDLLFADLPVGRAEGKSVGTATPVPQQRAERKAATSDRDSGGHRMSGVMRAIIWIACMTAPIWLLIFIATGGSTQGFWPLWPILFLGGVLVAQKLTGAGRRG